MRWFLCPVIGSGTEADPYRAKVADLGVDHSAMIPSRADGTPRFLWCIVAVDTASFTALDTDTDLDGIPDISLSTELRDLSAAARNRLQTALSKRGIDTTGITLSTTVGQVLLRVMRTLDPSLTRTDQAPRATRG